MTGNRKKRVCMICGSEKHVLCEGGVMLCTACIAALGEALGEKLPHGGETGGKEPTSPR